MTTPPLRYRCYGCGTSRSVAGPRTLCAFCRAGRKRSRTPDELSPFEQAAREIEVETGLPRAYWIYATPNSAPDKYELNERHYKRMQELARVPDRANYRATPLRRPA